MTAAKRVGFKDPERFKGLGTGPEPPGNAEELMAYCGVTPADRREMLAARPDPEREPEWWAVTGALAAEVERDLGLAVPSVGFSSWPSVPADASPTGLFAPAWALLASLPGLRELHAQRGVPESVTVATVSALGGVMGTHRHIHGRPGVGLMPLWSTSDAGTRKSRWPVSSATPGCWIHSWRSTCVLTPTSSASRTGSTCCRTCRKRTPLRETVS
ncbi:hypothetical protein JOF29_005169 [Kribbella aluminosa]|uniref:N-acyltransferase N-terminal domain-containing protein n=1 Tax=Kribbella aluminosa TaxID=416017 RepID=A0ABS4UR16_9ACTN|nr:acyltransferase domain-containing protein [Kribbella aluminosa]MBP2354059.1 hypothetical protein [Kribbella aluminosa]